MTEKIQLQVGEKTIRLAGSVNNLGVYFDTSLTMEKQVNAISKYVIIIFVMSVVSDIISQGLLGKPWPTSS